MKKLPQPQQRRSVPVTAPLLGFNPRTSPLTARGERVLWSESSRLVPSPRLRGEGAGRR
ncbi:hypothetical protein GHK35_16905, partial [Sinorhizobium meliloti]|nr:hypothetical protein [Sinorhizobium meliloti]